MPKQVPASINDGFKWTATAFDISITYSMLVQIMLLSVFECLELFVALIAFHIKVFVHQSLGVIHRLSVELVDFVQLIF